MENETSVSVQPERRKPRYHSIARAYISGVLENAIVKDLSSSGCCLVCAEQQKIPLYEKYVIHILPDDVTRFEVLAESRWIRTTDDSCEIGFSLISSSMLFAQ